MRRWSKTAQAVILLFSAIFSLAGCSATELENRCFPMLAVADSRVGLVEFAYGFPELSQKENTDMDEAKVEASMTLGGDFMAAVTNYNRQLDKTADCNHLKVFVLGEELLADREQYGNMLKALRESELFPRNIYVCATRSPGELWETEADLPTDLGSYLEVFLMNHEKEHGGELVTLGTILDETQNHRKSLCLPHLSVEEGVIVWDSDWKIE